MNIIMSGLEHSLAPIELRERLSFTKAQTAEIVCKIRSFPDISGCVLISTCNRTEIYISSPGMQRPDKLLCQAVGTEYEPYQHAFLTQIGEDAVEHLMEVSAGLRSRIWGEDQIITQVKNAILIAREAGTANSVLETMFRYAIAAGKEIRSRVHLTSVPTSAASMAVRLLGEKAGGLAGKSAMVIGNGEMGRLSASLLQQAGCRVLVTLRTYRHGETIVPPGCGVIPFEERFSCMEGTDILISATTSPHYTILAEQVEMLENPPAWMVDLAIPRDIQPQVGKIEGVCLYNIDDLGDCREDRTVPEEVREILKTHKEQFYRWLNYKACLPTLDSLKEAIIERLIHAKELEEELGEEEIIELSVDKTVDLLMGGLSERVSAEQLSHCEEKIRSHTTVH